tara:strand:+ start:368 stop:751 length:384 start_codon:yes stop_codon:yes gene_type:complete
VLEAAKKRLKRLAMREAMKKLKGKDPKSGMLKKLKTKKYKLGGEAATSVGRATVRKSQIEARRKQVDDSINRVYSKVAGSKKIGKIKPKEKAKESNRIKPKKKPKKPSAVGVPGVLKKFSGAFKKKK